jgi:hypothetical protein
MKARKTVLPRRTLTLRFSSEFVSLSKLCLLLTVGFSFLSQVNTEEILPTTPTESNNGEGSQPSQEPTVAESFNLASSVPQSPLNDHNEITGFGDKFDSWNSWKATNNDNGNEGESDDGGDSFLSPPTGDPTTGGDEEVVGNNSEESHIASDPDQSDPQSNLKRMSYVNGRPFIPIFTRHTKIHPKHKGWGWGGGGGGGGYRRKPYKKCRGKCRGKHHKRPSAWSHEEIKVHDGPHHDGHGDPISAHHFSSPFPKFKGPPGGRGRKRKRRPRKRRPQHRRKHKGHHHHHYDDDDHHHGPPEHDVSFGFDHGPPPPHIPHYSGESHEARGHHDIGKPFVIGGNHEDGPQHEPEHDDGHDDGHDDRRRPAGPPSGFGPFKGFHDAQGRNPFSGGPKYNPKGDRPDRGKEEHSSPKEPFWSPRIPEFSSPRDPEDRPPSAPSHFTDDDRDHDSGKQHFPTSINDMLSDSPSSGRGPPPRPRRPSRRPPLEHHDDLPPPSVSDFPRRRPPSYDPRPSFRERPNFESSFDDHPLSRPFRDDGPPSEFHDSAEHGPPIRERPKHFDSPPNDHPPKRPSYDDGPPDHHDRPLRLHHDHGHPDSDHQDRPRLRIKRPRPELEHSPPPPKPFSHPESDFGPSDFNDRPQSDHPPPRRPRPEREHSPPPRKPFSHLESDFGPSDFNDKPQSDHPPPRRPRPEREHSPPPRKPFSHPESDFGPSDFNDRPHSDHPPPRRRPRPSHGHRPYTAHSSNAPTATYSEEQALYNEDGHYDTPSSPQSPQRRPEFRRPRPDFRRPSRPEYNPPEHHEHDTPGHYDDRPHHGEYDGPSQHHDEFHPPRRPYSSRPRRPFRRPPPEHDIEDHPDHHIHHEPAHHPHPPIRPEFRRPRPHPQELEPHHDHPLYSPGRPHPSSHHHDDDGGPPLPPGFSEGPPPPIHHPPPPQSHSQFTRPRPPPRRPPPQIHDSNPTPHYNDIDHHRPHIGHSNDHHNSPGEYRSPPPPPLFRPPSRPHMRRPAYHPEHDGESHRPHTFSSGPLRRPNAPSHNEHFDHPSGPSHYNRPPPRFNSHPRPHPDLRRPMRPFVPHYDQALQGPPPQGYDHPEHAPPHSPSSRPSLPPPTPPGLPFYAKFHSAPGPPYGPLANVPQGPLKRPINPNPSSASYSSHNEQVHRPQPTPGTNSFRAPNPPQTTHHSILDILNDTPNSSPPRKPLLAGPRPTAVYHPMHEKDPDVVYGRPMGQQSGSRKPKITLPIPFKPIPSSQPPPVSYHPHENFIDQHTIKHGSHSQTQSQGIAQSVFGSMKNLVNKLNPYGSTPQSDQLSQPQQQNPFKPHASNGPHHAGLLIKPMMPRPSGANSMNSKGNTMKYSTLPQKWEHFKPDPTHKSLPNLTYDHSAANGLNKLLKQAPKVAKTMAKFTAADAIKHPMMGKRTGEDGIGAGDDTTIKPASDENSITKDEPKPVM